jgi:3-oxoacyl-[acyl-carrier protein] reductase
MTSLQPYAFRGKTAVLTGAASGIGEQLAYDLARRGSNLVLIDRDAAGLEAVAGKIRADGTVEVDAVAADLSDLDSLEALAAGIRARHRKIGLLVNNAGIAHQALFEDLDVRDFDRMFAVHVRGTFLMTKAVLGPMLVRKSGVIINIASQLGQIGGIELAHYSGAKAAIIGMTKSLAREVSSRGVRVNAVAPGPINTPLVMELSEEWRERKKSELPLGRFGEPEEVAETVAFLASPAASLFVGQTLGPNSGDVML